MSDDKFDHVTTDAFVEAFEASTPVFAGILREVRELSKKKPEATMSAGKVKLVNRVLTDLLTFLKEEPAGKYLEELDEDALPQVSDAVLTMVQFETAIQAFRSRYYQYFRDAAEHIWVTEETVAAWSRDDEEDE